MIDNTPKGCSVIFTQDKILLAIPVEGFNTPPFFIQADLSAAAHTDQVAYKKILTIFFFGSVFLTKTTLAIYPPLR